MIKLYFEKHAHTISDLISKDTVSTSATLLKCQVSKLSARGSCLANGAVFQSENCLAQQSFYRLPLIQLDKPLKSNCS